MYTLHGKQAFESALVLRCQLPHVPTYFIHQEFLFKIAEEWRELQITIKCVFKLGICLPSFQHTYAKKGLKDLGCSDTVLHRRK